MKYNWLSYPWRVMLVSFQFNFSETKTVTVFSLESILAKLTNVNVGNTWICSSGSCFKFTSFPLQIWSVSLVDLQVNAKTFVVIESRNDIVKKIKCAIFCALHVLQFLDVGSRVTRFFSRKNYLQCWANLQNGKLGPFRVKIVIFLWICSALQAVLSFSAWEKSRDSTHNSPKLKDM